MARKGDGTVKIRFGFVTNSSSSNYVIRYSVEDEDGCILPVFLAEKVEYDGDDCPLCGELCEDYMIPGHHAEGKTRLEEKICRSDSDDWVRGGIYGIAKRYAKGHTYEPEETLLRFFKKAGFDPEKMVAIVKDEIIGACGEPADDLWSYVEDAFTPSDAGSLSTQTGETMAPIGKTWEEEWTDEDYEKMAAMFSTDTDSIRLYREGMNEGYLAWFSLRLRTRETIYTCKKTILGRRLTAEETNDATVFLKEMQEE